MQSQYGYSRELWRRTSVSVRDKQGRQRCIYCIVTVQMCVFPYSLLIIPIKAQSECRVTTLKSLDSRQSRVVGPPLQSTFPLQSSMFATQSSETKSCPPAQERIEVPLSKISSFHSSRFFGPLVYRSSTSQCTQEQHLSGSFTEQNARID